MLVAHPVTGKVHNVGEAVAALLVKQNGFLIVGEKADSTAFIMRNNRAVGI